MKSELEYIGMERDEEPTELEHYFLNKLDTIELSDTEMHELLRPIDEKEVINILRNEVDLDSSPGEDGITSRFLLRFMGIESFREVYIRYLNYTRKIGSMGKIRNIGVMVVKIKANNLMSMKRKES